VGEYDDDPGVGGRRLFGKGAHYAAIDQLLRAGGVLKRTRLTAEFTLEHYRELYGEQAIPMFMVDPSDKIQLLTQDWPEKVEEGHRLVGLVIAAAEEEGRRDTGSSQAK
jgi:CPA1 family monovalent cation:H+ antiporter